jgi:hypothetical protein
MRKLLLLSLLVPAFLFSQENSVNQYTVSGKVIDELTKKPIDYATIVFRSSDSGIVKFGGITNHRGNFNFEFTEGSYIATIEFLSYQTKTLIFNNLNSDVDLGTIELEHLTENLDEIEVVATKKQIEIKANKLVFNVEKDLLADGNMATDVLNNIPSVSVDPDGKISLNGMENPTILIDGNVSMLTKADALKSIPAGSIEKVEVLSNPGAKYKASSTGVINIILKKGKNEGFNTSATASVGYRDYYGGLVNLNYKTEKVNIYFNPSYFHKNVIKIATSETEYLTNNNPVSYLNENSEFDSKNDGIVSNFGADFYLSSKATLGAVFNYSNIKNKSVTDTYSEIFDANLVETGINYRVHNGNFYDDIFEVAVNFEQQFKSEEQLLTASVIYSNDNEKYSNLIVNTNLDFTDWWNIEENTIENLILDFQYNSPITENSGFAMGYYGEFGAIPFTNETLSGTEEIEITENLNAAFIEYENYFENFYIGVGLRAEFSDFNIDYISENIKQTKNFDNLFPSTYLEFTINDYQNITFTYSKNINRPNYYLLQPFEQKYTETLSYIGNEQLNPVYIHMARLSYLFYSNSITLSPAIYFNKYNDYWQEVTYETGVEIDGIYQLITTPENIGYVNYYGGDITLSVYATDWLSFTAYANFYNFDQHGTFETINEANELILLDYNFASFNGSQSLTSTFKIPKIFNFQLNIENNMRSVGAYSTRKAYTYLGMAINKDFENSSLSLNCTDIFNSYKTNRDRYDKSYYSKSLVQNKFQTVILSYTYRFNQDKHDRKIDFDKKDVKPKF